MHISYELFIIPVIVDILENFFIYFFSTKFIMSLYSVYIHEYTNTVLFILVFVF